MTQHGGEEISPWVGLSFAGLYLAGVAAVGAAALHVQSQELAGQRLEDAKRWSYWFSRYLAGVGEENRDAVEHAVRQAARDGDFTYLAVVSPDGTFAVHSDPGQVGRTAPPFAAAGDEMEAVRVATEGGETILASRILSASGGVTNDELRVGLAPIGFSWKHSDLLFWMGYVLLAVMGLYLLAYRLFRRTIKPLAVIRRQLLGCQEPVAERLLALRLNDSFDQISTSWNRLIEFVAGMQEQLQHTRLHSDVSSAMDSYRSERLTGILMQIPFGVLVVGVDGTISFANRAAGGMLASEDQPLENSPADAVFGETLMQSLLAPRAGSRAGPPSTSRWTDHTFERPHGEVTLRFWSIPSDSGERSPAGGSRPTEYIVFVQDVTQVKQSERARDQFLYHVTHELRTPLTNIRAYAETLSEGVIDDEQTIRECYNVIMGETWRLNQLVEDILNVSQLEVGSARLEAGEVVIDELLRKVVQDTQGSADGKNIDLVLGLPAKLPKVRGDRDRLAVVFTNLVGNAVKYTPKDGRVDIRAEVEGERLRVSVSDTGIGIAPEDQERIFEKFYRVDDERVNAVAGTGLGLSIVKETVRLHGGTVTVESTPEKGSTFTVVLPAIPLDRSGPTKTARLNAAGEKV